MGIPPNEPGKTQPVKFIAEVGSNYDGSLETALKYVAAARRAGADVVKFQTLRRDQLVVPKLRSDAKCVENPVYRDFSNLELPDEWHYVLKNEADNEGIEFMSTPFYLEAVQLLEAVGVKRYKIASGDITFAPLLEAVGPTGKPVLLSTGASTLCEIEEALSILDRADTGGITLLHCVASYPPEWSELNLRAIGTLRETFGLPVGLSDHSPGSMAPLAATTLGCSVIEKHMTFDRTRPGPDHCFSMTVEEFTEMVRQVRNLEEALGSGDKVPSVAEEAKRRKIRRRPYDPESMRPTQDPDGLWLRPEGTG